MTPHLLCCLFAVSGAPQGEAAWQPVYQPSPAYMASVRGQSPITYEEVPPVQPSPPAATYVQGGTGGGPYIPPSGGGVPYGQPGPSLGGDPFLQGPGPVPIGPGPGARLDRFAFGNEGAQPYDYGFTFRMKNTLIPEEDTDGLTTPSDFGVYGHDLDFEYTHPTPLGWVFSFTQEVDQRSWDGPQGPVGLPGHVHRFGWDFELSTPRNTGVLGPLSAQVAFNPSINSSLEDNLTSDAYNWDARGALFYQVAPHLLLAGGAGYWDRVNDRVIPYAGVVYAPNQRWEFRLMAPESRISYVVCNTGCAHRSTLYARAAYHVEAYEVETGTAGARVKDKLELQDWRIVLGWELSNGWLTGFAEAGWVLGREMDFLHDTQPDFDVDTGFLANLGLRF